MKRLFTLLSILAITSLHANCCPGFYVKLGSGVSFSESANVSAPPPTWDAAEQGYNSRLGNVPIADLSFGYEFRRLLDLELGISNRSTYKYRKFQTPVAGGSSYTREFDIGVTAILFTANLLGRDIRCLNWNIACGEIYPVIGASVGAGNVSITNFRTTGLPATGGSSPFASFSDENQHTEHRKFIYTAQIGLEYNYHDCWALSTGYRFFNAGSFKGPRYLRVDTGSAVDVSDQAWKMRLKANEWFIELKYFI